MVKSLLISSHHEITIKIVASGSKINACLVQFSIIDCFTSYLNLHNSSVSPTTKNNKLAWWLSAGTNQIVNVMPPSENGTAQNSELFPCRFQSAGRLLFAICVRYWQVASSCHVWQAALFRMSERRREMYPVSWICLRACVITYRRTQTQVQNLLSVHECMSQSEITLDDRAC